MVSAGTRGAAGQPSLTASRAPLVFPPGTQAASPRGPLRCGSKGTRSCRAPGGSVPGPGTVEGGGGNEAGLWGPLL